MHHRFMGCILVVAVTLAFSPSTLPAQSAARKKTVRPAPPDLSGIWVSNYQPRDLRNPTGPGTASGLNWGKPRKGGGWGFLDYSMEQPSLQPWAAERLKIVREGTPDPYLQPIKELEPANNCMPSSMPWVYDSGTAMQLVQLPKKILMLFDQGGQWRQIHMDGRKNPEGAPEAYMGYSTGKWEGDTLVVETVGINELTWIDRIGHFHSDALRVVERIRRPSHDRLEIEFLFDDPKVYTKPWKGKKVFLLEPDRDLVEEFPCEDTWRQEYSRKLSEALGEKKGPHAGP